MQAQTSPQLGHGLSRERRAPQPPAKIGATIQHALLGGSAVTLANGLQCILSCDEATAAAVASPNPLPASIGIEPHYTHLYHMIDDGTMYICCLGLGLTFGILSLATTGRFIMSL